MACPSLSQCHDHHVHHSSSVSYLIHQPMQSTIAYNLLIPCAHPAHPSSLSSPQRRVCMALPRSTPKRNARHGVPPHRRAVPIPVPAAVPGQCSAVPVPVQCRFDAVNEGRDSAPQRVMSEGYVCTVCTVLSLFLLVGRPVAARQGQSLVWGIFPFLFFAFPSFPAVQDHGRARAPSRPLVCMYRPVMCGLPSKRSPLPSSPAQTIPRI